MCLVGFTVIIIIVIIIVIIPVKRSIATPIQNIVSFYAVKLIF